MKNMRIMAFLIFLFVIYLYACFNTSTWLHCSLFSVLRFSDYTIFNYSVAKFERVRQYCVWMINWQFIDLPPLFHLFINMHNISPNKKYYLSSIEVLSIQDNWDPTKNTTMRIDNGVFAVLSALWSRVY